MTIPKPTSKPISPRISSLALAAALLVTIGCSSAPKSTPAPVPGQSPTLPQAKSESPSILPSPNEAPEPPHSWTNEQILTCTVSQCWQLAGRSEDTFFDIVQQLAAISARNRDLTLPDSEEAGRQVGEHIKSETRKDHQQLLYAVVDAAVRKVGTPASTH